MLSDPELNHNPQSERPQKPYLNKFDRVSYKSNLNSNHANPNMNLALNKQFT